MVHIYEYNDWLIYCPFLLPLWIRHCGQTPCGSLIHRVSKDFRISFEAARFGNVLQR